MLNPNVDANQGLKHISTEKTHSKMMLSVSCFCEFNINFTFFGIISVLLLFFINNAGLSAQSAYGLWGSFLTLSYILAFIGGILGGTFFSFQLLSVIGLGCIVVGCSILAVQQQLYSLIAGLAWISYGYGLAKPNLINLLGSHYQNNTTANRNNGFTLFYYAKVLGQFCGPLVIAYLYLLSPFILFSVTAACTLTGLASLLIQYTKMPLNTFETQSTVITILMGLLLFGIIPICSWRIIYAGHMPLLLMLASITMLSLLTAILITVNSIKRINIIFVLITLISMLADSHNLLTICKRWMGIVKGISIH